MDEKTLWGLLLLIYTVPFWFWQMSEYSTIEARRKLYPGRENEERQEKRFTNIGLLWCVGLVALLVAWKAGWDPIAAAVTFSSVLLAVFGTQFAVRHWNLMAMRTFRLWVTISAVWALAIGVWYLVFGRVSELHEGEFFSLAFSPPFVAAFAVVAWRWAIRKP